MNATQTDTESTDIESNADTEPTPIGDAIELELAELRLLEDERIARGFARLKAEIARQARKTRRRAWLRNRALYIGCAWTTFVVVPGLLIVIGAIS